MVNENIDKIMDNIKDIKLKDDDRFKFIVLDHSYAIKYECKDGIFNILDIEINRISNIHNNDDKSIVDKEYINNIILSNFHSIERVYYDVEGY